MFYILTTYCDTVSSFVGYGKKTAWSIWNTLPQLTNALLKLSCAPREIPNDVMLIIEICCLVIWQVNKEVLLCKGCVAFNGPIFSFAYNFILYFCTIFGAFITKCTIVTYFSLYSTIGKK